jgi:hypothetical protein
MRKMFNVADKGMGKQQGRQGGSRYRFKIDSGKEKINDFFHHLRGVMHW